MTMHEARGGEALAGAAGALEVGRLARWAIRSPRACRRGLLGEDGVEHGVGDLVSRPCRDGLRSPTLGREEEVAPVVERPGVRCSHRESPVSGALTPWRGGIPPRSNIGISGVLRCPTSPHLPGPRATPSRPWGCGGACAACRELAPFPRGAPTDGCRSVVGLGPSARTGSARPALRRAASLPLLMDGVYGTFSRGETKGGRPRRTSHPHKAPRPRPRGGPARGERVLPGGRGPVRRRAGL